MTCSHRRFGWVVVAAAGAVLMVVSCSSALRSCARGDRVVAIGVAPSVAQAEAVSRAVALRADVRARAA